MTVSEHGSGDSRWAIPARVAALVASIAATSVAALAADERPPDPRSVVLLEQRCFRDDSLRAVTLFANGTIRLREGVVGGVEQHLAELAPEELADYVRQLGAATPTDGLMEEEGGVGVDGLGVEECELLLAPPGRKPIRYRFAPLEVPTLRYARHLTIAEALIRRARPKPKVEELEEAYLPKLGHVLRDTAGDRYKVTWVSVDGWVELDGLDQPFHLVLHITDLRRRFVARVDRPADRP